MTVMLPALLIAALLAQATPPPDAAQFTIEPDLNKGVWLSGPNLPAPRQDAAAAVVGGRIYVVGGFGERDAQLDSALVLEPVPAQLYLPGAAPVAPPVPSQGATTLPTGTWTPIAPIPVSIDHAAAAELGGYLYVVGGRQGRHPSGGLWRYDPVTDVWAPMASMPIPRYQPTMQGVDGKLYVIGGQSTRGRDEWAIEVYDPEFNQWTLLKRELEVEREQAASALVGDQIVLLGGHDHDQVSLTTCDLYRPSTDQWSFCQRLHSPRSDFGLGVVGDRLMAIGGEDPRSGSVTQTSEISEHVFRGWLSGPWMPFPRHGAAVVALGGAVWVIGGASYSGTAPTTSVLRYVSPRVRVKFGPRVVR